MSELNDKSELGNALSDHEAESEKAASDDRSAHDPTAANGDKAGDAAAPTLDLDRPQSTCTNASSLTAEIDPSTAVEPTPEIVEPSATVLSPNAKQSPSIERASNNRVNTDLLLSRLAALSQVGMLVVIAWGYFATVRPVFQLQLLQEQTARLTMEKETATAQLAKTRREQAEATAQLETIKLALESESEERSKLVSELGATRSQLDRFAFEIAVNANELAKTRASLARAQWELLFIDLTMFRLGRSINAISATMGEDADKLGIIESAKVNWPRPYDEFVKALDSLEYKSHKFAQYPPNYVSELRSDVERNRATLVCEIIDFDALNAAYVEDRRKAEVQTELETQVFIEDVIEGYRQRKERVLITDEYRESVRQSIRVGKDYEVNAKYRRTLKELQDKCSDKMDTLSQHLKNTRVTNSMP